MNYKQLRETVSELNDKYVKLKRTLEDALDNIDESNLATTLRKKLNGYDTQFSVTAEKIESKVSYEDLENNLNQYSTVSQTAQAIEMSVVSSQEYTDNSVETLSSTFTMTADGISTRVSKLKKGVETQFNQTAEKIESLAFEKMNTSEAVTVKEKPSASDKTLDKEKLYKYNNKYYYFTKPTMNRRLNQERLDHNNFDAGVRGEWRKFNPQNPYADSTDKPEQDLKVESLDDLFEDDVKPITPPTPQAQPKASENVKKQEEAPVLPMEDNTREDELFSKDLQEELEAKFDELFGSVDTSKKDN